MHDGEAPAGCALRRDPCRSVAGGEAWSSVYQGTNDTRSSLNSDEGWHSGSHAPDEILRRRLLAQKVNAFEVRGRIEQEVDFLQQADDQWRAQVGDIEQATDRRLWYHSPREIHIVLEIDVAIGHQ